MHARAPAAPYLQLRLNSHHYGGVEVALPRHWNPVCQQHSTIVALPCLVQHPGQPQKHRTLLFVLIPQQRCCHPRLLVDDAVALEIEQTYLAQFLFHYLAVASFVSYVHTELLRSKQKLQASGAT